MAVTSHGAPWIVDGGTARRGPCEGGGRLSQPEGLLPRRATRRTRGKNVWGLHGAGCGTSGQCSQTYRLLFVCSCVEQDLDSILRNPFQLLIFCNSVRQTENRNCDDMKKGQLWKNTSVEG